MTDGAAPDWALVEQLYRAHDCTLAEIARRSGIPEARIRRKARALGWPPRRKPQPPRQARRRKAAGLSFKERLIIAMDKKLTQLEQRLEEPDTLQPAASERHTREMGSLVRQIERLGKVDADKAGAGPEAAEVDAPRMTKDDDAERWRHEIADRIARIREQLQRQ